MSPMQAKAARSVLIAELRAEVVERTGNLTKLVGKYEREKAKLHKAEVILKEFGEYEPPQKAKVEEVPQKAEEGDREGMQVYSETNDSIYYIGKVGNMWTCTCPHFKFRIIDPTTKDGGCKHIYYACEEDLIKM